jgi:Alw26I/Eco31I/Esp3I family type II restriction m6 adenine DNA methyltransferase
MDHLALLEAADRTAINGKDIQRRAAGQFYTHELIGRHLAAAVVNSMRAHDQVSVIDPFGGDARLVAWLLPELAKRGVSRVRASVWEQDPTAATRAVEQLTGSASVVGVDLDLDVWTGDTFDRAVTTRERFDLVVTNPPWELLKPDHRELRRLPVDLRDAYVAELRAFDQRLANEFPVSQPSRRFAGWGTNLSRVGTEVALRLTAEGGVCGVVCPSSLLADSTTATLRRWMIERFALVEVTHWPAEARLFDNVDVPCLSFVAVRGLQRNCTRLTRIGASRAVVDSATVSLDHKWLERRDFAIPVQFGAEGLRLLERLDGHPRLSALEGRHPKGLWAGRELDETARSGFTVTTGEHPFVRSRHVHRLAQPELPQDEFVDITKRELPRSVRHVRLVWRDISRPSQKRRIHASLLPAGPVTGNSVSVAHFRDGNLRRLVALLGLVSSLPFEFQVRSLLMTNHVSLSVMRAARLPVLAPSTIAELADATYGCLAGRRDADAQLEQLAASAYGLDFETWGSIANWFALDDHERKCLRRAWSR